MTRIVTAKPPRYQHRRKLAKAVEVVAPVVTAKKPAVPGTLGDDGQPVPEEVREFLKRMMRPPGA
jgi:hypothetical protein